MHETRERHGWHWCHWLGLALAVYVTPMLVVWVDAFLFRGRLHNALGPEIQSFLETVYTPVGEVAKFFGWAD
jgi:hypothetical protein